jgi:hypothetical protein
MRASTDYGDKDSPVQLADQRVGALLLTLESLYDVKEQLVSLADKTTEIDALFALAPSFPDIIAVGSRINNLGEYVDEKVAEAETALSFQITTAIGLRTQATNALSLALGQTNTTASNLAGTVSALAQTVATQGAAHTTLNNTVVSQAGSITLLNQAITLINSELDALSGYNEDQDTSVAALAARVVTLEEAEPASGGGGGTGGATSFLELSDTPNSFAFNAGKFLAVTDFGNGIAFVDAPTGGGGGDTGGDTGIPEAPQDGNQYARKDAGWSVVQATDGGGGGGGGGETITKYVVAESFYKTNKATSISTSGFATKGTIYELPKARVIFGIESYLGANQTLKFMIVRLDSANPGTITEVVYESDPVTYTVSQKYYIGIDNVELDAGVYGFVFVRTDGSNVSPVGVSFPGEQPNSDPDGFILFKGSIRYATKAPVIGDNTYHANDVHVQVDVRSIDPVVLTAWDNASSGSGSLDLEYVGELGGISYSELDLFGIPNATVTPITGSGFSTSNPYYTGDFDPVTGEKIFRMGPASSGGKVGINLAVDNPTDDTLHFRYNNNSEIGYDYVMIFMDGVQVYTTNGKAIGAWNEYSFLVPAGPHIIQLYYRKDGSGDIGDDTVYISRFGFASVPGGPFLKGNMVVENSKRYIATADTELLPSSGSPNWALLSHVSEYILSTFVASTIGESEIVQYHPVARDITIKDASKITGVALTGSASVYTLTLKKNNVAFATIEFANSTVGIATMAEPTVFEALDILTITGATAADATLSDIAITIKGTL